VDALVRLRPALSAEAARVAAHGVFGLLNSTPHSVASSSPGTDPSRPAGLPAAAEVLRRMALAALTSVA
jgi:hypothetical protein